MIEWFRQLALREQIVLGAGGALAIVIIGWQFLWLPLIRNVGDLRDSVDERSHFVVDLRRAANAVPAAGAVGSPPPSQSLMLLVEETARPAGLSTAFSQSRILENGSSIRLTIRDAPFATLVAWLIQLERQYGLRTTNLSLNPTGQPGLVQGQLELSR